MVIGSGKNTCVWRERWLGKKPAEMVNSMKRQEDGLQPNIPEDMHVSDLLCSDGREWNVDLLGRLFTDKVKNKISIIHPAGRK